jgi:hypothetical protein
VTTADDLALIRLDVAISYEFSAAGRIARSAASPFGPRRDSPALRRSAGARLHFAGCTAGNLAHLRRDVGDETAALLLDLAANEPPWADPDAPPACLDEMTTLLAAEAPVEIDGPEIMFHLPNGLRYDHSAALVHSDTPQGDQLLTRLERDGLPKSLIHAGFVAFDDFWWPWCVALEGEDIAAMAFTPHLGEAGAEIGVFTFPAFRGRGYAAAVTAGWASHPSLKDRTLIYGTRLTNRSSRQVAARLGLNVAGARVRINER